jgi:hypothetical protein
MSPEQKAYREKYNWRQATKAEYAKMSEMQKQWYDWWKDIKFPTPKELYGMTMPPIILFKDGSIIGQGFHGILRNVKCGLRPIQPE